LSTRALKPSVPIGLNVSITIVALNRFALPTRCQNSLFRFRQTQFSPALAQCASFRPDYPYNFAEKELGNLPLEQARSLPGLLIFAATAGHTGRNAAPRRTSPFFSGLCFRTRPISGSLERCAGRFRDVETKRRSSIWSGAPKLFCLPFPKSSTR